MTRSFAGASVDADVVVARSSASAVEHFDRNEEEIDAVLVDASTVANVPRLVATVEDRSPGTPAFVHWTGDEAESISVLTEVIGRADPEPDGDGRSEAGEGTPESFERLPETITRQLESASAGPFDRLVGTIKRRLADADSPGAIERAIREEFTADDRFAFAWVGEYDRGEREIVPWLTETEPIEWPMHRTFAVGDGSQPLLERALGSRRLHTVRNVAEPAALVPLGETARERGVESVTVAPLSAGDDLYGILVVYGFEPPAEAATEAIRSIADTTSAALESVAVRGQLAQQERALRRYERLVETAGDGMYVLDGEGHFTTVNDALLEMTDYSREGLLGEHVSLLIGDEGVDAGAEIVETLLASDRNRETMEIELDTKGGRTIPCEIQLAALVHDGDYRGSVGVVRDITDRKRRERALQRQNERLDAFARIVSHDLRNPLGVSQGYLDLLEETESLEHVDHVRDGLARMEAIVEDVLAIAREGDEEWAAHLESVDLESIVTDAWENVSTADATLAVEGSTTLSADRSRLLRLLENLFRNSVEHGGSSVTVRVGVLESTAEAEVEVEVEVDVGDGGEDERDGDADGEGPIGFFVEDDGDGMPEAIRERAFDSQFTTSSSGLGIGLWVVREVATGHGWTTVATESEDGGARFEFVIDADAGSGFESETEAGFESKTEAEFEE